MTTYAELPEQLFQQYDAIRTALLGARSSAKEWVARKEYDWSTDAMRVEFGKYRNMIPDVRSMSAAELELLFLLFRTEMFDTEYLIKNLTK